MRSARGGSFRVRARKSAPRRVRDGFHFSLGIPINGCFLWGCCNLLQDVHHQVFPEPPGFRPSVENKPEGRRICLKVRQHANGREIIAQPMSVARGSQAETLFDRSCLTFRNVTGSQTPVWEPAIVKLRFASRATASARNRFSPLR